MAKGVGEKLVIGAGALALLILGVRAIRLLWTGAVLVRKRAVKGGEDERGA